MKTNGIPDRADVPAKDKWDLTSLYMSDSDWESDLSIIPDLAEELLAFKGKLAESADTLRNALDTYCQFQMTSETTGNYAFLLISADAGDSSNQEKYSRYLMVCSQAEAKISFFIPELQAIPDDTMKEIMERPDFADYRIWLEKKARMKPYILSEKEERIMALQTESGETAQHTYKTFTDVDLNFGKIKTAEGMKPLTQSTWSSLIQNPDREIRRKTYRKYYGTFNANRNTLASLYAGSVNQDIFKARARGYDSVRQMRLFPDKVDESVYDNLVSTVRANLEPLHKYYGIMKKMLGVDELRHYDVYVPLFPEVEKVTPYEDAVEIIRNALSPLGKEYTDTLCHGLLSGWVDKYENKGKQSGAFSAGGFVGVPFILINYKEDVLRSVFTLAHEGGHSMHTWYSKQSNVFMNYDYTIFEAEVASTFNEQLVFQYMMKNASDEKLKQYLIAMRAGDIIATLYRQTMFAEFEHTAHVLVEQGKPLSADVLRAEYRKLLEAYFGPEMHFEKTSDLEGLRIPHFYRAYYVYKYATGISASLALAKRVSEGGKNERDDYFKFLKSGGSRYPIESLKIAGVDMSTSAPVQAACDTFADLVRQMEAF